MTSTSVAFTLGTGDVLSFKFENEPRWIDVQLAHATSPDDSGTDLWEVVLLGCSRQRHDGREIYRSATLVICRVRISDFTEITVKAVGV